jgi:hypothetical protein
VPPWYKKLIKYTFIKNYLSKIFKNLLAISLGLISLDSPTTYVLMYPPRKESIDFTYSVGNIKAKGLIPAGDLYYTTFAPFLDGAEGGISEIELILEGKSYQLELPWGKGILRSIAIGNEKIEKLRKNVM